MSIIIEAVANNPQGFATIVSGAFTMATIAYNSRAQRLLDEKWKKRDEEDRKSLRDFEEKWRLRDAEDRKSLRDFEEKWRVKDAEDKTLTKYLQSVKQLNDIRKDLRYQIYSTPHREVSVATRVLKTFSEPEGNLYSKIEFYHKFKDSSNENILRMNDYRSLCRDNFSNIRSLMEEYVEKRPIVEKLAIKSGFDFNHKLLTKGDSKRLEKRFKRFVETVKPMDRNYPNNNDDELYNSVTFQRLLDGCTSKSTVDYK